MSFFVPNILDLLLEYIILLLQMFQFAIILQVMRPMPIILYQGQSHLKQT